MTAMQRRSALLVMLGIFALIAVALWVNGRSAPALEARPFGARPRLLLLSGLPLQFGDDFSLAGNGSPALSALEHRYRVSAIGTASSAALATGRLILIAQPPAQPAENLVALDAWVRRGGHALVLADPRLEWPSARPLGDPLAPPPMFADTGLLGHWGLRLDAPEQPGPRIGRIGGLDVMTGSPGTLVATGSACRVEADGLVAYCRLGRGRATIIADADFLDVGRGAGLDGPTDHNVDALLRELAKLD